MTNYLITAPLYQARSEEVGEALIENVNLDYLQNMLQNFKMKCLALLNKDRGYFQYNSGDLVYLISPLTTQLRTSSRKLLLIM